MRKRIIAKGKEIPYLIDEYGRTYSERNNGKLIQPYPGVYSRTKVKFENKYYRWLDHRMVAQLFIPNPNPEIYDTVNHKDGDKYNNHYTNLEWTNRKGNSEHYHKELKPSKLSNEKDKSHREIYQEHFGVKIKKGHQIHHIDFNKKNNDPSNLIEVTVREHGWLHRKVNWDLKTKSREEIREVLDREDVHNTVEPVASKETYAKNGFKY
jgi:hypothetical protein